MTTQCTLSCTSLCVPPVFDLNVFVCFTAVEPQFIGKVDQQKSKNVMTGSLYSQYTTSDKHENYHMKQPTSGTTPLSQSTRLGSVSPENVSTKYPLLLGKQNPEPVAAKKTSRDGKGHLSGHVSPSSLPVRGPDALYNMSSTLAPQDDGEIEVTSVKKWKAKKKKHKKKKRTATDSEKTSADHDSTSEQVWYGIGLFRVHTVYIQVFEEHNFHGFCGCLANFHKLK